MLLFIVIAFFIVRCLASTEKMDCHKHFEWLLEQPKIKHYRQLWHVSKRLSKSKDTQIKLHPLRPMSCRDYRHFESVEAAVVEYMNIWQNTFELATTLADHPALMEYQEMLFNGVTMKHLLPPVIFANFKITRNLREGRSRLVFKGEPLVEVADKNANKMVVSAAVDSVVVDWCVEARELDPDVQSLMIFVPVNRKCFCGKFKDHVEQEPVYYDLLALERIRFLNKGLSRVNNEAAIKELVAMAKAHPDMYRVYRDFYPHSYVDPIYGKPPCFIEAWHIREGQYLAAKTHAYSIGTRDLFGQLREARFIPDTDHIVIESSNYHGQEILSLTLLGKLVVLDKVGMTKRAPIESYIFHDMVNSTRVFPLIVAMSMIMSLEKVTAFLTQHSSMTKVLAVKIPKEVTLVGILPRRVQEGEIIYWRKDGSVQRAEHAGALVMSSKFKVSLFYFQGQ